MSIAGQHGVPGAPSDARSRHTGFAAAARRDRIAEVRTRKHAGFGFTLIEVMVVLGVMGLMVGTLVMGFGAGRSAEVSRAVNQIAATIRYGYDKAKVSGDHYRLLIDLEAGTVALQQGDDRMYLPATDRDGKPKVIEADELEDREDRDRRAAESYFRSIQSQVYKTGGGDTDGYDPYAVQQTTVPRRKPPLFDAFEDENALSGLASAITLPEGVRIIYVRTAEDLQPTTSGQASVYFFPQGRTQFAHIQIKDEDGESEYTIKVQPLTGKVTISDELEELVAPETMFDQEDALGNKASQRSF